MISNYYFIFCLRYEYKLVVVPGLVLNDSIKSIVQKIANNDQSCLAAGKTFTIRSMTANHVSSQSGKYSEYISFSKLCTVFFTCFIFLLLQKFHSQIHEIEHIEVQPDAWLSQVLPSKTATIPSNYYHPIILISLVIAMCGFAFYIGIATKAYQIYFHATQTQIAASEQTQKRSMKKNLITTIIIITITVIISTICSILITNNHFY